MTDSEIKQIVKDNPHYNADIEKSIFYTYKDDHEILSDTFFKHNILFFLKITNSYATSLPIDERISLIYESIVKALRNYNPEYSRFTTYSTYFIRRDFNRYFDKLTKHNQQTCSLNAPIYDGDGEFGDTIPMDDEEIEYSWNDINIDRILEDCSEYLSPKEDEYFRLWVGGMSQSAMVDKFKVSHQMPSAMIKRAITKIRNNFNCMNTKRHRVYKNGN